MDERCEATAESGKRRSSPLKRVRAPESFGAGRRFVNPYLFRIPEFDGRIFAFQDYAADVERIRAISSGEGLVVEIGSGSGQHLLSLAGKDKSSPHFGFELRYKRTVRTLEKGARAGCENVFVLLIDGRSMFDIFPAGSLKAVYVNFPDPWDRKKWRKHRILTAEFLDSLTKVLRPGGIFSFKSDHRDYFLEAASLLRGHRGFEVDRYTENLVESEFEGENVQTEFERLFRAQGLPIHYVRGVRGL